MAPDPLADLSKPQIRSSAAVLLTASGLAAAFAVASCCGLPFVLATLGFGTAWLYGIAELASPHRSVLLIAAAAMLVCGSALVWDQSRIAGRCASNGVCAKPAIRGLTTFALFAGFALLYLGYAYV